MRNAYLHHFYNAFLLGIRESVVHIVKVPLILISDKVDAFSPVWFGTDVIYTWLS